MLTILLILNIIQTFVIVAVTVALIKTKKREDVYKKWVESFKENVRLTYQKLKSIDEKQIFERDDEVGAVFTDIVAIMEEFKNESE